MTKACALIGPLRGVLKKTLPGVGSFLELVSAQFEASEAFLILVTLHKKAKQKSSRGEPNFHEFYTVNHEPDFMHAEGALGVIQHVHLPLLWLNTRVPMNPFKRGKCPIL